MAFFGSSINDPKTMGILQAASALLGAGGPSRTPISFGQALGGAVGAGLQGMQNQQQVNSKLSEDATQNAISQFQLNELRRQVLEQNQAQEFINAWQKGHEYSGPMAVIDQNTKTKMMINDMFSSGNPVLIKRAQEMASTMKSMQPKWSTSLQTALVNGKPSLVQASEEGEIRDTGYSPADKKQMLDTGGQFIPVNPYTGEADGAPIASTLSPQAVLNANITMRGQDLTNARAKESAAIPQFREGSWVLPPSAENPAGKIIATDLAAPAKGSVAERQKSAALALDIISKAESILNKESPTHSGIGAGIDWLSSKVGYSTEGSKGAAKLKAFEGALMMAMPRMEGPQSDKDTALYRQMAAQIGDQSLPIDTRLAALEAIKQIHQKASGGSLFDQADAIINGK